jgi:hypothetical protein
MLNGVLKNLSNLGLSFVINLWDATLELVSKAQVMFEDKAQVDENAERTR